MSTPHTETDTDTDTEDQTCSICISALGNRNVCTLECGHSFHYNCVFRWNSQHQNCPVCRNELDVEPIISPEPNVSEQNLVNHIDFRDIIQSSNVHGFKVQCKECETFLVECHHCKEKMCDCVADHNDRQYQYYNMKNPFSSIDSEINTCASCFFERDSLVLEHIGSPNINLDEYLYNHNFESIGEDPYIKELYETYYVNNSNVGYNIQVYGNLFREYTDYESFISYIQMIHEHELNRENWNAIPNQESTEQNISDFIDNFEDIYNHIFMNIPNISNIPINNTNVNIIPRTNIQNIQQIPSNQQFLIQYPR